MYRYRARLGLSYERQGYIYFRSRMYRLLDRVTRKRLREHCRRCAGEHWRAVLDYVTTDRSQTEICLERHLSASTLQRAVKRYYENFPDDLF